MSNPEQLQRFWQYIHNYQILNYIQRSRLDETAFRYLKDKIQAARASVEYADWDILDFVKRGLQKKCTCSKHKPEFDDSELHKPYQKLRTLVNQSTNYQNFKRVLKRRCLSSDKDGVLELGKALKQKLLGVKKSARIENLLISGPIGGCGKTATLRFLLQIFPLYEVQVFMTSNSAFPFDGILSHRYPCLFVNDIDGSCGTCSEWKSILEKADSRIMVKNGSVHPITSWWIVGATNDFDPAGKNSRWTRIGYDLIFSV